MRRRPSRSAAAPSRARRVRGAVALTALLALLSPAGAQFLPEVQVTKAAIPDNEYDWGRKGAYCATCNFGDGNARWAFSDHLGNLWLAKIDYQTGDFIPSVTATAC